MQHTAWKDFNTDDRHPGAGFCPPRRAGAVRR